VKKGHFALHQRLGCVSVTTLRFVHGTEPV
jgi:hypothetical protein